MQTAVCVPGHEAAVSNQREPAVLDPPGGGLSLWRVARVREADQGEVGSGEPGGSPRRRGRNREGNRRTATEPELAWSPVVKRVLLAAPRGFCAGVERAIATVEQALELYGAPVYVRKQIVHNVHVVRDLERRGAVFVESEDEVPETALLVLSAHGVAPSVYERAASRRLHTIDATCPLVTKVHVEARRYAAAGYTVVLVGHAGHEEVVGTCGEAPDAIRVIGTVEEAEELEVADRRRVAYVTQTTLSVDDAEQILRVLRRRFPRLREPRTEDICYATTNRQSAVKSLAREVDVLLVIGSENSSNSNRLVEVGHAAGVEAHLIEDESRIERRWLERRETVGLTAGASAPEGLVARVCDWFRAQGVTDIRPFGSLVEDVFFRLPLELRRAATPAA
jgi:4-hydroxy-3-methylbut-2-en-1-yl diphosphate reductase